MQWIIAEDHSGERFSCVCSTSGLSNIRRVMAPVAR